MKMTRERTSFTFDSREMLQSLQMGFSFVKAALACSILERNSGLKPSSEITGPRYLMIVTVPSFCSFTFTFFWMPLALFIITLVFCCCFYFHNDVLQVAQRSVSIVAHTQHRVRSLSCCQSFSLSVSPAQQAFCVDDLVEVLSCQAGSTGSEARPGANHAKTQAATGLSSAEVCSTLPRSQRRSTLRCPISFHCLICLSLPRFPIMWVPGVPYFTLTLRWGWTP